MADTLGNRVTTTTRQKLMPLVVDTVLNSNVFASKMLKKAKKWSGNQIAFPVKYQVNSTATSFTGFDPLSTSATDNRVKLQFDPSFTQITSALPLDELSTNMKSGKEEAIINLIRVTLESDAMDLADNIGTQFWGTGTGNGGKDFLGLGALVDDGTTVGTIGGLSRTTYTTLKSTVTASSGTLSLSKMATLYNNVTSGSIKPTIGFTDEATFSLYEQLLTPQERYVKSDAAASGGLKGGTGYLELFYKGFPILRDEKATAGSLYFLNEDFLSWYALPMEMTEPVKFAPSQVEGNDYTANEVMGLGFSWSGWIKPTNAAAVVGHIFCGGQLVTNNPKRHGVLTGITTV
jgi:hypothetical protein